jgi:hypothetical protein
MSDTPLNLYEVLIEEYNSQGIDPPIGETTLIASRLLLRVGTLNP